MYCLKYIILLYYLKYWKYVLIFYSNESTHKHKHTHYTHHQILAQQHSRVLLGKSGHSLLSAECYTHIIHNMYTFLHGSVGVWVYNSATELVYRLPGARINNIRSQPVHRAGRRFFAALGESNLSCPIVIHSLSLS